VARFSSARSLFPAQRASGLANSAIRTEKSSWSNGRRICKTSMALAAPGLNSRTPPRAAATAGERKACDSPWRQRRRSWHKRKAKAGQKYIATSVSQQLDSWTALLIPPSQIPSQIPHQPFGGPISSSICCALRPRPCGSLPARSQWWPCCGSNGWRQGPLP